METQQWRESSELARETAALLQDHIRLCAAARNTIIGAGLAVIVTAVGAFISLHSDVSAIAARQQIVIEINREQTEAIKEIDRRLRIHEMKATPEPQP